ncbi:MerR family transcriptional regulator [Simplicispira metamorpha]|jgi:DNA-binding transcriptional MerR regulator|uniref:DNA-binding transcriptional MerR regulator n=1 Tax=Simplicispira metamorpha TaxID=80881 RepID=A0A4R2NGU8_9BURK|nr:MerR family transcriptional regulator [Simplicispira metamorpha]MBP8205238.1 MerR family transcriptional regulator [Giesbergeria sp.]TCP20567.1 DNA-binding transcriptional MerR regulator [Simplicispira metamorpha]
MRIGELARRTGTTPKALRLYEARGLLGTVARAGSYRQYGEQDVVQVQLIRQAQALGFRLSQLDGLNALHTPAGWTHIATLVATRRAAVARELERLQALAHELATLEAQLHTCDSHPLHLPCAA